MQQGNMNVGDHASQDYWLELLHSGWRPCDQKHQDQGQQWSLFKGVE